MKKILTFLFVSISFICLAQQGINYKALIKDASNAVVANQSITLQFIIYEGAGETTNVYQETHTPTTDANGIIIVNIGEGTTSDVFTDIDWGSEEHYLNVQIDTGSGLTDMGTTQFMAVPYAMHALNVSGLKAIDEGNGIGWRLSEENLENYEAYGNIGNQAIDLTINTVSQPSYFGALGSNSVAIGRNARALGSNSLALGNFAAVETDNSVAIVGTVSGESSFAFGGSASGFNSRAFGGGAFGDNSRAFGGNATGINSLSLGGLASGSNSIAIEGSAVGDNSITIGNTAIANADYGVAIGDNTLVNSYRSSAIGRYNVGTGTNAAWVDSEPLFEIGNGTDFSNRSNAFTVLKNGNVGIGTNTPSYPLHITRAISGLNSTPAHYLAASSGVGTNGNGWTYSIGVSAGVYSSIGFATGSDNRIKDIVGISNSDEDLNTLMALEITDYTFKDYKTKGDRVSKKVIAQQVKEVLPNAVNLSTEFIPNIYDLATVSTKKDGNINLDFKGKKDIQEGDILKLITKKNNEVKATVIAISNNRISVDVSTDNLGEQVFVYGKQVTDFHSVDYDAISMLNVSATQAQQKLIEQLKQEIKALQSKNRLLSKEVSSLQDVNDRLTKLEALLITNN